MKVLLVTGRLAEELVRKYGRGADVKVCDVDVAAFITPSMLEDLDLSGYDLVLVPGLTYNQNWEALEKKKGVKIRLGPLHAYDLQHILKFAERVEFSHSIPACRLIEAVKTEEVLKEVESLEETATFEIGNVRIGGDSRMKIVAEIVNFRDLEELKAKIDYYTESGADIIDIGVPLEFEPDWLRRVVKFAVDNSKLPVSVDSFSKKAIEIAVKGGAEMIMSISSQNVDALEFIEGQAVVVVERSLEALLKLLEAVRRKTERVIADPVLDPPLRVVESIERYAAFRRVDRKTPLLFGVGNVTELCDADSIGINALLAFMAEELNCNILFTTEASPKTSGCVRELRIAAYMAKAAKIRGSPPKDTGISLLALKEKVRYEEKVELVDVIRAEESGEFVRDPMGDFIIGVIGNSIFCKHEKVTVLGRKAKEIVDTVISKGLVSRLDHAAYLGRELMKAEIAAVLRKSYVQDRELNFGFYGN